MGKILVYCAPEYGHMNIALEICKAVLERSPECEVAFVVDDVCKQIVANVNPKFKSLVFDEPPPPTSDDGKEGVRVPFQLIEMLRPFGELDRVNRNKLFARLLIKIIHYCESIQGELDRFVKEFKPDLILIDHVGLQPNLVNKGIPWTHLYSVNLNIIRDPSMPPPIIQASSLNKSEWPMKNKEYDETFKEMHEEHLAWFRRLNATQLPKKGHLYYESPYFNVYMFPKQLDYDVSNLSGDWLRIDAPFLKYVREDLPPEVHFEQKKGEIMYFSLGSFLSLNKDLMQRLVKMLEDLPFNFIVSAGESMNLIEIPKNCWAQKFVNQRNVLQNVKLIVSHCGNNTLSECFYHGVRMVPLPIYGDQLDNANRMHELGYTVAPLDPFTVTKEQLHEAIFNTKNMPPLKTTDKAESHARFEKVVQTVMTYLK